MKTFFLRAAREIPSQLENLHAELNVSRQPYLRQNGCTSSLVMGSFKYQGSVGAGTDGQRSNLDAGHDAVRAFVLESASEAIKFK